MTAPFRDPIIYPGALIEPAIGKWGSTSDTQRCVTGGENMPPGTLARWTRSGWECRDHYTQGSAWIKVYHQATCARGGERIPMGTLARWAVNDEGWECRDHVDGVIA